MLERFCGVDWRALPLEGSSLVVEPFEVSDDQTGFVFRDGGATVTYAPGLARIDDAVVERLAASDVVLVDGTFWHEDDLARQGISSDRTARDMGHVPLAGPGGTLEVLAGLERPRKILVHINNTNPILLEDSPEREAVVRAGVEVAYDGLEVVL
jgi:pyrroloquinoline quinone biosynthesis protein B